MQAVASFISDFWPFAVTAAPGAWAIYKLWANGRKANRQERADLIEIAERVAGSAIVRLEKEIDRLGKRVVELQQEISTLRKEHADMMALKDAKIALLEGEIRQKQAKIDAYERTMRKAGIEPPHVNETYVVEEGRRLVPEAETASA